MFKSLSPSTKKKIISLENLSYIKNKHKNEKIIMCHGVFDVVHPGHIRHFLFAKSKANILVVSCTSDKFINKGIYRPHVPEKLRAFNLAVLEMIDYVIIDNAKKPLNLITKLKPNFFAKGFEYNKNQEQSHETKEEIDLVESYGGEMIFTPGDIVFSSSKIIDKLTPKIDDEKLLYLIEHNNIKFEKLEEIIKNFKKLKVHVVGDTIVDTYTNTNFIVGQSKTPTFSLLYESEKNFIGGAAIVALHLKSAGAKVRFTSLIGKDKLGTHVAQALKKQKIILNLMVDKKRPTVNKNLISSGEYKLVKIDKIDNSPINNSQLIQILNSIKKSKEDIIILSDFRHGIFNNFNIDKINKSIPSRLFKVADSQVASRWGNITLFKNFDLLTPNEREARFALADQDSTVGNLANSIYQKTNCKNQILKLGDKGVFCLSANSKKNKDNYFSLNSFLEKRDLVDAVGAGDALLAYSSLSLKLSNCLISAAIIGSLAASCACENIGNKPISSNKVLEKLNKIKMRLKV
mgnify:CR=1 FL=1|tara:strand:- start:2155 stop:3708 length:1554 start_codon:yes stop_codon:yes gene_type:complete